MNIDDLIKIEGEFRKNLSCTCDQVDLLMARLSEGGRLEYIEKLSISDHLIDCQKCQEKYREKFK